MGSFQKGGQMSASDKFCEDVISFLENEKKNKFYENRKERDSHDPIVKQIDEVENIVNQFKGDGNISNLMNGIYNIKDIDMHDKLQGMYIDFIATATAPTVKEPTTKPTTTTKDPVIKQLSADELKFCKQAIDFLNVKKKENDYIDIKEQDPYHPIVKQIDEAQALIEQFMKDGNQASVMNGLLLMQDSSVRNVLDDMFIDFQKPNEAVKIKPAAIPASL